MSCRTTGLSPLAPRLFSYLNSNSNKSLEKKCWFPDTVEVLTDLKYLKRLLIKSVNTEQVGLESDRSVQVQ